MSIRLTTLSLILAATACTPTASPSAETSPTVTQSAIDTAYWTEQPYCSGRYQLRLPSKRRHGSTWLKYNGWSVMVMFNDWKRNVSTINENKQYEYSFWYLMCIIISTCSFDYIYRYVLVFTWLFCHAIVSGFKCCRSNE